MQKLLIIVTVFILVLSGCSKSQDLPATLVETEESTIIEEVIVSDEEFAEDVKSVDGIIISNVIADCGKIKSSNLKSYCEDSINHRLAVENNDESYCLNISTEAEKDGCLFLFKSD